MPSSLFLTSSLFRIPFGVFAFTLLSKFFANVRRKDLKNTLPSILQVGTHLCVISIGAFWSICALYRYYRPLMRAREIIPRLGDNFIIFFIFLAVCWSLTAIPSKNIQPKLWSKDSWIAVHIPNLIGGLSIAFCAFILHQIGVK